MLEYLRPRSVEEALSLLEAHRGRSMLVAGGTDVLVGLRAGKFSPEVLISLQAVDGFDGIERTASGGLRIGALATHDRLRRSPLLGGPFAALAEAAGSVGSRQIRNRATVGGNLANGLPSADAAGPLLVLDASLRLRGRDGERVVPLEAFYLGPGRTALAPGEILLEILLPPPPQGAAGAYLKQGRRKAMEIMLLGVALLLDVDPVDPGPLAAALARRAGPEELREALDASDLRCREARLALGAAAPVPMRARAAEAALAGRRLTTEALSEAGRLAAGEARPRESARAPAWYRRRLIEALPTRVALVCVERALAAAASVAAEVPG